MYSGSKGMSKAPPPVFALVAAVIAILALAALAGPAWAETFTVNSTDDAVDVNPGDGTCATADDDCTLRAAVMETNALVGPDTITVPGGTYTLTITGDESDIFGGNDSIGDLDIFEDLTINGAGARSMTVRGGGEFNDRIFDIPGAISPSDPPEPLPSDAVVEISGLTITRGDKSTIGGGIRNVGTLTLKKSAVTNNTAGLGGAGIRNDFVFTLVQSTVSGNTVGSSGPAPAGVDPSLGGGGGLFNNDEATLVNSTISGNTSGTFGGGITNFGGGASLDVRNVTLNGNSAPTGANIANTDARIGPAGGPPPVGPASFENTIVSNPRGGGDNCEGPITSDGGNLEFPGNSCDFEVRKDPRLGALANNGGPTNTHALRAGSPAIDAAKNSCPPPATDQRGVGRPKNGDGKGAARCDIGAYERKAPDNQPNPNPNPNPDPDGRPACTITGTNGDDVLTGTDGRDVICARGGDDTVQSLDGNDVVFGGSGNDSINGGDGDDRLFGGDGRDSINGGDGRDVIKGGRGNDAINGGPGKDQVDAGPGENSATR